MDVICVLRYLNSGGVTVMYAWSSCETMRDCKVLQEHGELEIIIVIHNVIVCLVNAITRLRQVAV